MANVFVSGLAGIDETHLRTERTNYILHLRQLLQQSEHAAGQYRLVYWRDKTQVPLDEFLLAVVREELENETLEVDPAPETPPNFESTDGPGVNPGSLYFDPEKCYKLDRRPKGLCLIINISNFGSSTTTPNAAQTTRTGSEADVRKLQDTFRWMGFQPAVYRDLKRSELLRILDECAHSDHSAYDAFVCCIMSHGTVGRICTADRQKVQILGEIVRRFYPGSCPTLAGKPKIFFVQCCLSSSGQRAAGEFETSASGTTFDAELVAELCRPRENVSSLIPDDAPDLFVCYSTLPDCLSFRLPTGTLYVDALTDVLRKGLELQISLDEVAQRVEQKAASCEEKLEQRPFYHVSTDHKAVFLCGKLSVGGASVRKNYMCPPDPSHPLSQRKVYVKIHEMCQNTAQSMLNFFLFPVVNGQSTGCYSFPQLKV